MKRIISSICLSLVIITTLVHHSAAGKQTIAVEYTPASLVVINEPPELKAEAYLIFDIDTGEILAAKQADAPLPIASVTKLVTATAVLNNFLPETEVQVTATDIEEEGRSGRLSVGETYTYYELLFPLLLESSNDAAAALERSTQGQLIIEMNDLAKQVGAKTMKLADASGLSDRNVASAQDLAQLMRYVSSQEPRIFDITRLSKRAGPYVSWSNNSPVLNESYRGGKHGFTEAANRTLVALFNESFVTGQRTLGYVILGSDNLSQDIEKLRTFVSESVTLE